MEKARRLYPDIKWVLPPNFHVTVLFLGDIDVTAAESASAVLDQLPKFEVTTVRVSRLAQFPRKGSPRVIVAHVTAGQEFLSRLHNVISGALSGYDGKRSYTPHITLGRVRRRKPSAEFRGGEFSFSASFMPHSVTLFQSELRPEGPVYTEVHSGRF